MNIKSRDSTVFETLYLMKDFIKYQFSFKPINQRCQQRRSNKRS